MSYLDRLKQRSENAHAMTQQNRQNQATEGFGGFVGALSSDSLKSYAYPDAVVAEPPPTRTVTPLAISRKSAERLPMGAAVFGADTDQNRIETLSQSQRNVDGTSACTSAISAPRSSMKATHIVAASDCKTCRHRSEPGRSDPGYCGGGRNDLSPAYGENHPLRRLPDDMGASCAKYINRSG